MSTQTRTWTVQLRHVDGGRWDAYVREVETAAAETLTKTIGSESTFGGGDTPTEAAIEALERAIHYSDLEPDEWLEAELKQ